MPLISVGGFVFRSSKERGLFIAVIDDWVFVTNISLLIIQNGVILEKKEFNSDEGDEIVKFLSDICVGRIVAIVSRRDISNLSGHAKKAIANVGGHVIEFVHDNASYVLLGRKGSSPGKKISPHASHFFRIWI
jgi:hypothetical protein